MHRRSGERGRKAGGAGKEEKRGGGHDDGERKCEEAKEK